MTKVTLTKTQLVGGVWEGVLTGAGSAMPALSVHHLDQPVAGLTADYDQDRDVWIIRVPVPAACIADGVQTFVISDADSGATLASFALLSGEALGEDVRAEVNLLRAELDMLKRSFRRHCNETM